MSICMRAFVQSCAPAMGSSTRGTPAPGDALRGARPGRHAACRAPSSAAASGTMITAAATQPTVVAEHAREAVLRERIADADEADGAQRGEDDVEQRLPAEAVASR